MGLLFIHSEDKRYDIYRMRSRTIWWLYIGLLLFSFLTSSYSWNNYRNPYPFLLLVILIFIGAIEVAPIWWYRGLKARYKGKQIIESGNTLMGNSEIKIEK